MRQLLDFMTKSSDGEHGLARNVPASDLVHVQTVQRRGKACESGPEEEEGESGPEDEEGEIGPE
jgi:hypothetical protein